VKIDVAVDIAASRHQLWTYIADISTHAEWMHDAESIVFAGETRSGVGTEFDVRTKIGPLHTADRMTITEWIDNEAIGVDHKGIVTGSGQFSLTAIGDRTTFRWTEEIHLPWRFGGRLGEIVAKPLLTLIWKRNLTELKRRVELGAGLPSDEQSLTPGALVGQGRDGDVRTFGPSKVIRISRSGADLSADEQLMAHVAQSGYPVPRVYHHPDKSVSVMDRIDGPTMMEDLAARPWRLREHAKTLADLHNRLRMIAPPDGLRRLGPGNDLLHLDLHPNNVLLSDDGPVVIDWSNAAIGSAGLDVALTWVLIKTGPITANPAIKALLLGLREQFVKTYARAAGEDLIRAHATAAAELRLLDKNLLATERDEVFKLARQLQDRPTHSRTDDA
jgi:tRNA A-37 threonylcarbamoyl transferase component Bud32